TKPLHSAVQPRDSARAHAEPRNRCCVRREQRNETARLSKHQRTGGDRQSERYPLGGSTPILWLRGCSVDGESSAFQLPFDAGPAGKEIFFRVVGLGELYVGKGPDGSGGP